MGNVDDGERHTSTREEGLVCEGDMGPCGKPAQRRPHLTAYESNTPENRPVLCNECFEGYAEYWKMMWDEYWSSQGVF